MQSAKVRKPGDTGLPLVACAGLLLTLLALACLRELDGFWRNNGGWPVWFRELVWLGFYPLLGLAILLLGSLTAALGRPPGPTTPTVVPVALLWGLLGLVVLTFTADNLPNLLEGRPLFSTARGGPQFEVFDGGLKPTGLRRWPGPAPSACPALEPKQRPAVSSWQGLFGPVPILPASIARQTRWGKGIRWLGRLRPLRGLELNARTEAPK
ncbi:MAG TPA: hypothetical protein VLM84_05880 [Chromatiaceae bacterium]|jgi:hypothetical protein|nr:hypothetical protein [Chromatiaceae bacterium]